MRTKLLQEYYDSDEYKARLLSRMETFSLCEREPLHIGRLALERWSINPLDFIEQFAWVPIPEFNNEIKPFFMFDYQKKVIEHIWEAELSGEDHDILIDKPRGMGLTWSIVWYEIWKWCFAPNWGGFNLSRTETEVDAGDQDPNSSLFGKFRWCLSMLPDYMVPEGYTPKGKKGNPTDMSLKIMNPQLGSSLIGSTTNQNAGRSRRYSFTFVDECFAIEHFLSVYRALQSVSRVKVFVSTVKAGKIFQDFKDMCEKKGDYISLKWQDHPFKDDVWYQEQLAKAEFDPEVMKEIEVDYAVNIKSQYYPEIRQAKIVENMEFKRDKKLYVSLDFGAQDLTVAIFSQFDGQFINILECVSSRRKPLEWYYPFLNPSIDYNPDMYLPHQRELLNRVRSWGHPTAYFGEAAHFMKVMPTNRSIADNLIRNGIRLICNNNAIKHDPRRHATSLLLPRTIFNFSSDGVSELYDAIANSRYSNASYGTSEESHTKPVHDVEIADFRSAFENFAVNFPRVMKLQREHLSSEIKGNNFASNLCAYLKL